MSALPDRCTHDKTWATPCPECEQVWRAECIARLERQAAKMGFRLVPVTATP